jgi:hypothetical protein
MGSPDDAAEETAEGEAPAPDRRFQPLFHVLDLTDSPCQNAKTSAHERNPPPGLLQF